MDAATLAKLTDLGERVAELLPETEVAGHGRGIVELITQDSADRGKRVRIWVDDTTIKVTAFDGWNVYGDATFANLPASVIAAAVAALLVEAGR